MYHLAREYSVGVAFALHAAFVFGGCVIFDLIPEEIFINCSSSIFRYPGFLSNACVLDVGCPGSHLVFSPKQNR